MEHPSWKKPLILASALLIVGTATYWLEFSHKPEKEQQTEQTKKLLQLKDTPVSTIELHTGTTIYVFRCLDVEAKLCKVNDQSKWELIEPVKVRADDNNVNALLGTLNNLNSQENIDLNEETAEKRVSLLKEYQLDEESRKRSETQKIVVVPVNGDKQTVYFGETHPITSGIFTIRATGDKVHEQSVQIAPTNAKSHFDKDLDHWRNKKLMTLATHEIDDFVLNSTLKASRKDGQWTINVGSNGVPGDNENIEALLSAATYLTAKKFTSENKTNPLAKSTLQSAKPVLTLSLKARTQEPILLSLFEKKNKDAGGRIDNRLYATVSNLDPLYEIEYSAKERLNKGLKELRLAKLLTTMDRFNTRKIEVSGPSLQGGQIVLTQKDSKWVQTGPDGTGEISINTDQVQSFLDKLSGNRIKDFISESAAPAGQKEGLKIIFSAEKDTGIRQLVFWKANGQLYAKDLASQRKEVYLVDPTTQEALPWDKDFFKKSAPGDIEKGGAGTGDQAKTQ